MSSSSKVEPRDYLGGIYPTLLSALSQLGARQPKEPYKWLSQYFLQIHNAKTAFAPLAATLSASSSRDDNQVNLSRLSEAPGSANSSAASLTDSVGGNSMLPAGSAMEAVRSRDNNASNRSLDLGVPTTVVSETDFIATQARVGGVESLATYISDPHSHSKRFLKGSPRGEDVAWANADLPHPFTSHHGMWDGFGLVKAFVVANKRMYILGKSSMIVVEDYAHRFDWNKIRILKSWPIPLDAVSVTANRNYVAIATKGEIEIYNTDGQKRGSVGRRTRRGQHTDYIAVQLSSNKNMLAAIDNEDRSVSVYGLKRQTWVLHAKITESNEYKLHNPLSVYFDMKVNKLWILDLQDGKDYLKVLNFAKYEIDCEYSLHADKHGKKRRQRSKKAAMAKFRELDDDNSGYLRGHEMRVLAAWVHETGFDNWRGKDDVLRVKSLGKEIMERLDANGDGRLQFAEFEAWFVDNYNEQENAQKKNRRLGGAAAADGAGHEEDDEFESHSPRQLVVDKNNHVLLLDVATNEVEVYKEVWKPTINADGVSIKEPHMKLVASLRETIDGKPLDNTFCLSLGGRDHILVGCETTFLRIPWFGNTTALRNKTQVIRRLGSNDQPRDFDSKLADHMNLQPHLLELRTTSKTKRVSKKVRARFFDAARDGDIVALKQMLAKGCELNMVDEAGNNALAYTLSYNHVRASLTLLSNGALHWNRHVLNTPSVILRTALTSDRFQRQFCKDSDDFRRACTQSAIFTLHSLSAKEETLHATIEQAFKREQRSHASHAALSDHDEATLNGAVSDLFKSDADDRW